MSRRSFRASVDSPRPVSAWVLVGVASAALWITQQLDPSALAAQALALVVSLMQRNKPFRWQRSTGAINCGMFAILAVAVTIASRGGPPTIALAHFTALTQSLQLLDARPRKSEFLLVTLALFQVVLASSLTDSVWFTPLLIAFVFSAVWTLLVHTLHMEAVEAGMSGAITRTLTPGLWRMTLLASAASVLLALLMFVALPRLHGNIVTGSPLGVSVATSGFSENVALGDLGRIRKDHSVVLRVETLEGRSPDWGAAYWRALSLDHFDGVTWSVTPPLRNLVPGSPEAGITLGRYPGQINLVQRIVREPVASSALFGVGAARGLRGTIRRVERDDNGGLYAANQANERIRYVISSFALDWKDAALRQDESRPPINMGRLDRRYLQLPDSTPRVAELASRITGGAETDADRLRAIESHLVRSGRYTDVPPAIDPEAETSPIEQFLFGGMAGHCEYFASSMVVLARSLGLSARIVNGFAGGHENSVGGFRELRRSDAHSWVEVHYANAGWVRYDPTPPDLRATPRDAFGLRERLQEFASAAELWWYQRVVGFDRADQVYAVNRLWLAWRNRQSERADARERRAERGLGDYTLDASPGFAIGGLGLLAALGWAFVKRQRRAASSEVPTSYAKALRLLARRRLVREPATSARDFSKVVSDALPEEPAALFASLTEAYLAERFGDRPARQADEILGRLRESLAVHRRGL